MNLHGRIMNLFCEYGHYGDPSVQTGYKFGHRDARHAAAELALEADATIDRLRVLLAHAVAEADGWHDECQGGPIEDDPLMGEARALVMGPNVRAEAGPTAKRQARAVENAPAHCAGLAF